MASKRIPDINGWIEVEGNPISKVGVFQYSGKFISSDLDPNELFWVYRPAESLSDPETIKSFHLVPWTNDHPKRLLGDKDLGLVPAEEKGIEGVIGQHVYFDPDTEELKGNIKVFSSKLEQDIFDGKRELSVGYRSKYEYKPGTYKGQAYTYIQTQIRGNHVASVEQGRMGPDIAVLDGFQFTIDSKEIFPMAKTNKVRSVMGKVIALAESNPELKELVRKIAPDLNKLASMSVVMDAEELKEEKKDDEKDDELAKTAKDAEECAAKKAAEDAEEEEKRKKDEEEGGRKANEKLDKEKKEGMDAKEVQALIDAAVAKALAGTMDAKEMMQEVGARDKLAERLSHFIGTFDASEMTHSEVAAYGVKKLELVAPKGQELATLNGYLHGRKVPTGSAGTGMDSSAVPASLKKFLIA